MDVKKAFLKQSYNDNWNIYTKTLEKGAHIAKWDLFIITASNEEQAKGYSLQIEERRKKGYLPDETEFMVIPDPDGKRVGSGGATLNALGKAYLKLSEKSSKNMEGENPFWNKRILMIHSGGDSKRIPQYSAFGKLFSKVPRELPDGRYSTLFDEFLISLSGIPGRMKDGLLVVSGDVLLLFNHNQIDFGRKGAVGIAIKAPAELGAKHGVYYSTDGSRVKKFHHKLPEEELRLLGAVNSENLVNIDTGLLWMDGELTLKLSSLVVPKGKFNKDLYDRYVNEKIRLNFYGDFLVPLTEENKVEEYLDSEGEGVECGELLEVRRNIWNLLSPYILYVQALSPAEFIHFGTTAEFIGLMGKIEQEYSYLSWKKQVVSYWEEKQGRSDITLINSFIANNAVLSEGVLVEDSYIHAPCSIGKGCVISNADISKALTLPEDTVLHQLPLIGEGDCRYVTRIYGVYDNPKDTANKGRFLNKPFLEALEFQGIHEEDIWEAGVIKDLWNARLYPACSDREESLDFAALISRFPYINELDKEKWLKAERISLRQSFELADQRQILIHQNNIEDTIRINSFISGIKKGKWVREVYTLLGNSREEIMRRLSAVYRYTEALDNSLKKARLYRCVAEVLKYFPDSRIGTEELGFRKVEDKCYEVIMSEIEKNTISPQEFERLREMAAMVDHIAYDVLERPVSKRSVQVEAPVRVNFGGGWSDTPPYSLEEGGTVLNAAVSLKGRLPIKVTAEIIKEPVIVFTSRDLDICSTHYNVEELQKYDNPADPLALHKAALAVTGIIPVSKDNKAEMDLKKRLQEIGGGISLTTEVDIPKGSGLGTSSILAGAVLKALNKLTGLEYGNQRIFDQVLCLEQLITTGGGWQDQVGGLVPGVKLVTTNPGIQQKINTTTLILSKDTVRELNERLVLVYTGQRRLAKGILREIMGEYIINNPEMLKCLRDIQKLALLMKFELEKGSVDTFAELLNEHWELSKRLDRGCTNSYLDMIIDICKPYISGVMICGAGGGGFLQMILKDCSQKEPLKKTLERVFQDNNVCLWDCELYL